MKGNFLGKNGRSIPFYIFQSAGFRLIASSLSKISPLFGVGIGTSTCCKKHKNSQRYKIMSLPIIFSSLYQAGPHKNFKHFTVKYQPLRLSKSLIYFNSIKFHYPSALRHSFKLSICFQSQI
ncbi:hypothetical protein V6Z11_D04G104800 [Gossypium hirsutum]